MTAPANTKHSTPDAPWWTSFAAYGAWKDRYAPPVEHEYTFDVKLFASLRIKATTAEEAEAKLAQLIECAGTTLGCNLDTEDGAELVEIDGEAV